MDLELIYDKKYDTGAFLDHVYETCIGKERFLNCPPEQMETAREELLENIENVLKVRQLEGLFGHSVSYSKDETFETFGLQVDKYCVDGIDQLLFPAYVIQPPEGAEKKDKTVVYINGHDVAGIMSALIERTDKQRFHRYLPIELAKAGYRVVTLELAGFAECDFTHRVKGARGNCFGHAMTMNMAGFSVTALRVMQVRKLMDFMDQMGFGGRYAVHGISGGGLVCMYTGIYDERVATMCLNSCTSTYYDGILSRQHCVDNYDAGILTLGDMPWVCAAFAPRPLFSLSGEWDKIFPVEGFRKMCGYLEKVYDKWNAGDKFTWETFPGGHEANFNLVSRWLELYF